jgi:hypothetical protein
LKKLKQMTMSNPFFDTSKSVANEFLQSVVFIDDRAYAVIGDGDQENKNHEFDAAEITQAFAKSQKICAVYQPKTLEDIENLSILSRKADITVIDWQINIKQEVAQEHKEEDAEEDDPRGPHTRKIIRDILSDPITGKGSLKLILVYTGEIGLRDITKEIYDDLVKQNIENLQTEDCKVFTPNVKILIVAKPSVDDEENGAKFKHNPELNEKVVKYEDLPEFILNEFSIMTSGLLSNFILQSLTVLRNNTFRLVKLYDKNLDSSFVSHRLLLPNQKDSQEQLIEILADSVQALLNYNQVGETVSLINIESWIDTKNISGTISVSNKEILLTNDFIKKWAKEGFIKACSDFWNESNFGDVDEKQIEKFETKQRDLHKEKGSSFLNGGQDSNREDSEFSILTHHKSNLKQQASMPKLSLGTIVKQEGTEKYYLCIQAKCDSVRVFKNRKFLFLPLEISPAGKKFNIVIEENNSFIKLHIVKESFELRTIKFDPTAGNDSIIAQLNNNGNYIFTSSWGEKLIWICDLKDAHAQRIAHSYAHQLSRIGLDESEWLRRWAGN